MSVVKISIIFIFILFSYFSYSSMVCAETFDRSNAVANVVESDVLKNAHKVISRELSNKEKQTILRLHSLIQGQSEPLTPKQIFNHVAFDLEEAGFNLYDLWNIAHSNVLGMSFTDKRNFKKLLKGRFSDNELGLPASNQYPNKLKLSSLFHLYSSGSYETGKLVFAYHNRNFYESQDTAVNNSHYLMSGFPFNPHPFNRRHQRILGWVDLSDIQSVEIKEPMERFITGRFIPSRSIINPLDRKRKAFAVYFLYEGEIIKEYFPFRSTDENWIAFGFDNGGISPVGKGNITLKHRRKDIGLLKYSFQRLKAKKAKAIESS